MCVNGLGGCRNDLLTTGTDPYTFIINELNHRIPHTNEIIPPRLDNKRHTLLPRLNKIAISKEEQKETRV